ncbi:hypothetical protein NG799_00945 [Laspinema sp. D1]|uniref:Uncharacterized protein n=1 Tax=Laspinema palackyanum D2a TaxID=2953684 RepID=A0ABT2MMY6_9CYAN|nr:hypothetical protein [Laspinema sp. D2a]
MNEPVYQKAGRRLIRKLRVEGDTKLGCDRQSHFSEHQRILIFRTVLREKTS